MITVLDAEMLAATLARAGLVLPDRAQSALDTLNVLRSQAHGRPDDAIAEALANPEPVTPANIAPRVRDLALTLTAQSRLGEASAVFEQPAVAEFFAAVNANAVQLIEAMKPSFATAAAIVQRAGVLLPPAAKQEDAWAAGPEGVSIFEQLPGAIATLDSIRVARANLGRRVGGPQAEREVCSFIAAIDGNERLVQAYMAFAHTGYVWHRLTASEFRLQLNTPQEALAVELGAQHADVRAAQQAQEARRKANYDPIHDKYFKLALGEEASSH